MRQTLMANDIMRPACCPEQFKVIRVWVLNDFVQMSFVCVRAIYWRLPTYGAIDPLIWSSSSPEERNVYLEVTCPHQSLSRLTYGMTATLLLKRQQPLRRGDVGEYMSNVYDVQRLTATVCDCRLL